MEYVWLYDEDVKDVNNNDECIVIIIFMTSVLNYIIQINKNIVSLIFINVNWLNGNVIDFWWNEDNKRVMFSKMRFDLECND